MKQYLLDERMKWRKIMTRHSFKILEALLALQGNSQLINVMKLNIIKYYKKYDELLCWNTQNVVKDQTPNFLNLCSVKENLLFFDTQLHCKKLFTNL